MQVSAKVMRSYDYCHFEMALSAECKDLDAANKLRKQAAILVDEAVRQYKLAKVKEQSRDGNQWKVEAALRRIDELKGKPRAEWSVEDAALMRSCADDAFWKEYEEDDYYYRDEERDYHFSMLEQFKETRVSAATVSKKRKKKSRKG